MELFNNGTVTPHRLHALLRLVLRMRNPQRAEIQDLLQPEKLTSKQDASIAVFNAAKKYNLIVEDNESKVVSLHETACDIEAVDQFRAVMLNRMAGVTDEAEDNYLFNFFLAWYCTQNETILRVANKEELTARFRRDMSTRSEDEIRDDGRMFNDTKFNSWLRWAAFLGWGVALKLKCELLLPDAQIRLRSVLPDLLPNDEKIPFRVFMERVATHCPELDGRVLFEQCWAKSRPNQARDNTLSLMLSTGLRTLHHCKLIRLEEINDTPDSWQLFPAEKPEITTVTHIQRGESA